MVGSGSIKKAISSGDFATDDSSLSPAPSRGGRGHGGHLRSTSLDLEAAARQVEREKEADRERGHHIDQATSSIPTYKEADDDPFLFDYNSSGAQRDDVCTRLLSPGPDYLPLRHDPEVVDMLVAHTKWQRAFLHVNLALPTVTMLLCLYGVGSIWLACVSFHLISCTLLPTVYTLTCAGTDGFFKLLSSFVINPKSQLMWGGFYFTSMCVLGVIGYRWIVRPVVPSNRDAVIDLGLNADPSSLALFGIYFSVVNPIVEELFWRGFGSVALGSSERLLWMSAICYASYHIVVLAAIGIEPEVICMCFLVLTIAGRIFAFLFRKTGLMSAAIAHSAADVVIVAIIVDWYYAWLERRRELAAL